MFLACGFWGNECCRTGGMNVTGLHKCANRNKRFVTEIKMEIVPQQSAGHKIDLI